MTTYFISDLHLSLSQPGITEQFIHFLNTRAKAAKALYILGDFFEAWLGDDLLESNKYEYKIAKALREYRNTGIPVYFMHGNRDFLIGKRFAEMSNCTILTDPYILELNGKRVVLTHGDSLCTLDKQYQTFRKIVQAPLSQKLFLSFPIQLRRWIANKIRNRSKRQFVGAGPCAGPIPNQYQDPKYDVTLDAVKKMLQENDSYMMIHGHTHKAGEHELDLNGHLAKRMVLGDWGEKTIVLKVENNSFMLEKLN